MNQHESNEPEEESDWFDESIGTWLLVAVVGASIVVPVLLWFASKFFGWEPPEFLMEWVDYFAA